MEMTFRWFGTGFDTVTLKQIRQIPGVTGVITTLYDTTPGEVWTREKIHALKEEVEASGLRIAGIEVVFAYYIAKQIEMMNIRVVMAGKLAGMDPEKIQERMRKTYE